MSAAKRLRNRRKPSSYEEFINGLCEEPVDFPTKPQRIRTKHETKNKCHHRTPKNNLVISAAPSLFTRLASDVPHTKAGRNLSNDEVVGNSCRNQKLEATCGPVEGETKPDKRKKNNGKSQIKNSQVECSSRNQKPETADGPIEFENKTDRRNKNTKIIGKSRIKNRLIECSSRNKKPETVDGPVDVGNKLDKRKKNTENTDKNRIESRSDAKKKNIEYIDESQINNSNRKVTFTLDDISKTQTEYWKSLVAQHSARANDLGGTVRKFVGIHPSVKIITSGCQEPLDKSEKSLVSSENVENEQIQPGQTHEQEMLSNSKPLECGTEEFENILHSIQDMDVYGILGNNISQVFNTLKVRPHCKIVSE